MKTFIQQIPLKLILFLNFSIALTSCNTSSSVHLKNYKKGYIQLPSGKILTVFIAETDDQQRQGLSNIKDQDFQNDWGMLFPEKKMSVRQFWMPSTYFNLDIVFMNQDYYILDVHKNLQHNPKSKYEAEPVYSKAVYSQHVLEVKADSPLAKEFIPGMVLKLMKKAPTL